MKSSIRFLPIPDETVGAKDSFDHQGSSNESPLYNMGLKKPHYGRNVILLI